MRTRTRTSSKTVSSMDTAPPRRRATVEVSRCYADGGCRRSSPCPRRSTSSCSRTPRAESRTATATRRCRTSTATSTTSTAPTTGWPHMLFLTGDQIYADDVAARCCPGSTRSRSSCSATERCPRRASSRCRRRRRRARPHVSTTVLPAGFRQRVTGGAGFTSDWAVEPPDRLRRVPGDVLRGLEPGAVAGARGRRHSDSDSRHAREASADEATASNDDAGSSPAERSPVVLGRPSPDARDDVVTPLYGGTQPAADALERGAARVPGREGAARRVPARGAQGPAADGQRADVHDLRRPRRHRRLVHDRRHPRRNH